MNSTGPKSIKVPNRENMFTSTNGYIALKKNTIYDNEYHKFNVNIDMGHIEKDNFYFLKNDQPISISQNIYV
jgi:hypothetical protein